MYALHSFAATVEGQANATKGDMLVLLDDSNSYWWLVRVVKDHTVGRHILVLATHLRLSAGRDHRNSVRASSTSQ
jgi:SH3 domain